MMSKSKLTRNHIRKLIKEEIEGLMNDPLSVTDLEDLEDRDDAWAGGDNLHVNADHTKAVGAESNIASQEVLNIVGESQFRKLVLDILAETDS